MKTIHFSKTAYTVSYIKNHPPALAKSYKVVWVAAVDEFLRREKFDFSKKSLQKPLELSSTEFAKIVRIFNTLIGKRNKPQAPSSVSQKKKSA